MADNEAALVLPPSDVWPEGADAVVFPGFPGRWVAGQPLAVSGLGFDSEEDATNRVSELNLPLEAATIEAVEDRPLYRDEESASSGPEALLPRSVSEFPGLTEDEAAARRAEADQVTEAQATMLPQVEEAPAPEAAPEAPAEEEA